MGHDSVAAEREMNGISKTNCGEMELERNDHRNSIVYDGMEHDVIRIAINTTVR